MKNFLLSVVFAAVSLCSFSQTPQKMISIGSHGGRDIQIQTIPSFSENGKRFITVQTDTCTYSIYDENFEFIRTFDCSIFEPGGSRIFEREITDTLFDEYGHPYKYVYGDNWILVEDGVSETYWKSYIPDIAFWDGNIGMLSDDGIVLTYDLFNTDEKFEYIRYIYELKEDYTYETFDEFGEVCGKKVNYSYYNKGFEIVSEDGDVISTIQEELNSEAYMTIVKIAEKIYLCSRIYNSYRDEFGNYNYDEKLNVYAIDKGENGASSIKKVTQKIGLFANPTLASENENIKISVGSNENGCKLMVTSVGGKTMKAVYLQPGETNIQLNTRGLPPGMYIISYINGKETKEHCKIIIR